MDKPENYLFLFQVRLWSECEVVLFWQYGRSRRRAKRLQHPGGNLLWRFREVARVGQQQTAWNGPAWHAGTHAETFVWRIHVPLPKSGNDVLSIAARRSQKPVIQRLLLLCGRIVFLSDVYCFSKTFFIVFALFFDFSHNHFLSIQHFSLEKIA